MDCFFFTALSGGAQRGLRRKQGEKLSTLPAFPRLHRGSATQSFKVHTKMLEARVTGGCADSSKKENSTRKGKIYALFWL